jgi:magnesium transporter
MKEVSVAFLIASLFSLLIFIYNFFTSDTLELTIMVSVSLFIVMMFASIFGTFIPMLLNRFNIDPAVATGPFITTMNDVLGIIVYFFISNVVGGFFN